MDCDIDQIVREVQKAPLHSPFPLDVSIAIVNDCFRMAVVAPVIDDEWARWKEQLGSLWSEQMGLLAHLLSVTSLQSVTVASLRQAGGDRRGELRTFFERIEPLTAEMIRSNAFRREECIRRWLEWCAADIRGESAEESQQRLAQLDYREALAEFKRAEAAREEEAEGRMERARKQKTAARGWRE
jgi:hypothetical protein